MAPLFIWWFTMVLLGLLALPLSFLTFKHLPDKGYAFSKPLGILFTGYFAWLMGHVGYNQAVPYFAVVLLFTASAFLLSRTWNSIVDFFKSRAGYILVTEVFFLTAVVVAGAFKMRTPDIVGTEKPMDLAMINGIHSSVSMPPNDPWLAGGSISYYYFGYFIVSVLAKLTGTETAVAYNLGVVMSWSLAGLAAFGLGYALTRKYRYAGFSAAAVTVFGNMDFWHRVGQSFKFADLRMPYYNQAADPKAVGGLDGAFGFLFSPLKHYWDYFQASRIIPVGKDKMINEFPAFSYFLSDLHPHVMAIPFVLLVVALALNTLKAPLAGLDAFGGRRPWQIAQWVLIAAAFGAMGFLNSWDYPTMMLLLGLCLALQQMWAMGGASKGWFRNLALVGLPIVAGSFALYVPFYLKFQSQAKGLNFVKDRTDLYHLLVLFGLFLLIVVPVLVGRAITARSEKGRRGRKSADALECVICGREGSGKKFCGFCGGELEPSADLEVTPLPVEGLRAGLQKSSLWLTNDKVAWQGWAVLGGVVAVLVGLTLGKLDLSVLLASLFLVWLGLVSLTSRNESKEMVFATLLASVAFLLIAGCEVLYIRDHFDSGDLYRMNTMFKFHYQAWILFAVACAPLLKWLFEVQWPSWSALKRVSWGVLAAFAFSAAVLYPVLTLKARIGSGPAGVRTLDGNYTFKMQNQAEAQAIEWIRGNVAPKGRKVPVILEATGESYHDDDNKLSTRTGFPTVLGWNFHEAQWRGSWDKAAVRGGPAEDNIMKRQGDVKDIYSLTDTAAAMALLQKYKVDYVFVGNMERAKYGNAPGGLEKFVQMGAPVFNYAGATLYRVAP